MLEEIASAINQVEVPVGHRIDRTKPKHRALQDSGEPDWGDDAQPKPDQGGGAARPDGGVNRPEDAQNSVPLDERIAQMQNE